jgi:hypothetical protein
MRNTGEEPVVHLTFLTEPGLWCWELRDRQGRLLESSWSDWWVGFRSRTDAATAAARRLVELRTISQWSRKAG